jgi:mannobiose 2-epimerase
MIKAAELEQFLTRIHKHLHGHILPFWSGPALDQKNGGWMGWLANDLKPDRTQPKGLIVHARILWAFSAAQRVQPNPVYAAMAERAFDYLMTRFWDAKYGGAFWRLNDTGEIMDDSKKTYGQAFYIYALAEYHRALGSRAALERAQTLFGLVEKHAHDQDQGGYIEVCQRDWSEAGGEARLSDRDMNEKKSMNAHLHMLEAYANLYRVWPAPAVAKRLRELVEIFLTRIMDGRTKHFHHFFDAEWKVRSDSYTFGHDIEGSWLLLEAVELLKDSALMARVQDAAVAMAEAAFNEGLGADGALCYEGRAGKIIDAGHECWPQAEALVGFINAYEISKDGKYLAAALRVWDYIEQKIVDRVHGEWFWRINENGKVDADLPKVSEWKGPYHSTRACLETLRRLKKFTA